MRQTVLALAGAIGIAVAGAALAAAPVPQAKLPLMPLPKSAFGVGAAKLPLASDSGWEGNAKAAASSTDPHDSAATLARAGRITGYSVGFDDLNLLGKAGNLVHAGSSVELYRDAAAASAGLKSDLRDALTQPGSGITFERAEKFDVPDLPGGVGFSVRARISKSRVWVTGVAFRSGTLVGEAEFARTDGRDVRERVIALARALAQRMADVVAGRVTTAPAPIPKPASSGSARPGRRAPGTPDLGPAVLAAADLPGSKVTRQGYVVDKDTVSAYQREFELGAKRYRSSSLANVESDVSLYASAASAALVLSGVKAVLDPANPSFKTFFTEKFTEGAGFKLTSLKVLGHGPVAVPGGGGQEITVRLGTPLGTFDAAFVYLQSGKLFGSIYMISELGGDIRQADVLELARTMGKRLKRVASGVAARSK